MVLVRTIAGRSALGEFRCAALASGHRCFSRTARRIAHTGFPARAAVPAAATTPPAAPPLTALTTLGPLTGNLALLSGGFHAGARLAAC